MLVAGSCLWHMSASPAVANNYPPTARIDVDPERPHLLVYDGETMFFDGSASSDNDEGGASIVYYEWFVNGDPRSIGPDRVTFSEPIYLIGGSSQTVKLRVKDDEGSWAEKTLTLTVTSRPKRYYYLKDHLGSVRVTVNENGDVVHYDDYYPFGLQMPGRSLEEDGPKERFTGHELDDETGLLYAGARYLDPETARWIAIDPSSDSYPGLSGYAYAINNPMASVDPDGRDVYFVTTDRLLRAAMGLLLSTQIGYEFLSQYARAGQSVGWVTFHRAGKYADASLYIHETSGGFPARSRYGTVRRPDDIGFLATEAMLLTGQGLLGNHFRFDVGVYPDHYAYEGDDFNKVVQMAVSLGHEIFGHVNIKDHILLEAYRSGSVDRLIEALKTKSSGTCDHYSLLCHKRGAYDDFLKYVEQLKNLIDSGELDRAVEDLNDALRHWEAGDDFGCFSAENAECL
jgi:RHS repeat-associated protein